MYGDLALKLIQDAKRAHALPHLPPYQADLVRTLVQEINELEHDKSALLAPFEGTFDAADDPATACAVLIDALCMRRNKRCLLAYHRVRTDKLMAAVWKGGDVLGEYAQLAASIAAERNSSRRDGENESFGPGNSSDQDRHRQVDHQRTQRYGDRQDNQGIQGRRRARPARFGIDADPTNLDEHEEDYIRRYEDLLAALKSHWTDIDLAGSLEPPTALYVDVRVLKDAGEIQTEYGSINLSKNSQFYVKYGDVERLIAQGYLQKLS